MLRVAERCESTNNSVMGKQWARAQLFERSPGIEMPTANWLALSQLAQSLSQPQGIDR